MVARRFSQHSMDNSVSGQ